MTMARAGRVHCPDPIDGLLAKALSAAHGGGQALASNTCRLSNESVAP